jgi:hypothetical protein
MIIITAKIVLLATLEDSRRLDMLIHEYTEQKRFALCFSEVIILLKAHL